VNDGAYAAIEESWRAFVKVRALCPSATEAAIGTLGYSSPGWYRQRGATYFVQALHPVTDADLVELRQMTSFVNRSFVISVAAMLEAYGVVPYRTTPDISMPGGEHALLAKRLRNHFAHGEYDFDPDNPDHVKTRDLIERLLPDGASRGPGFVASIDTILEPLKDGVLEYVAAHGGSG
jgi:hypothetical protein